MRVSVRLPAPPGDRYSEEAAEQMVGARVYAGVDPAGRDEIGYIVDAKRFNRGSVVVAEIELHRESDRLVAEMRAFHLGESLIP